MADELRKKLHKHGVAVSNFEAERCGSVRQFFDPAQVCTMWKSAEETLMRSATKKGVEEVMASNIFEIGRARHENRPCLVLHARHQNPSNHEQPACLLSTLWACDSAIASLKDGAASLTVGYNFEGAGLCNFSLHHALPFSRLFVNEYPCLVGEIYFINMPWALRQLLPLFGPLLSRRVKLLSVSNSAEFTKVVGYEPIERSSKFLTEGSAFQAAVPQAASWIGGAPTIAATQGQNPDQQPRHVVHSVIDVLSRSINSFLANGVVANSP